MKKIVFTFVLVLVAGVLISFNAVQKITDAKSIEVALNDYDVNPFEEVLKHQAEVIVLNPETDINVIEVEEEINLGIVAAKYLPIGFDAYEGLQIDPSAIIVDELEEEVELGFDVNKYLPKGFDAYQM